MNAESMITDLSRRMQDQLEGISANDANRAAALAVAVLAEPRYQEALDKARSLNRPMVDRLRHCAADTSSNWDGAITVYPPEARKLVALIDHLTEPAAG